MPLYIFLFLSNHKHVFDFMRIRIETDTVRKSLQLNRVYMKLFDFLHINLYCVITGLLLKIIYEYSVVDGCLSKVLFGKYGKPMNTKSTTVF
jgi:hypothetical protein